MGLFFLLSSHEKKIVNKAILCNSFPLIVVFRCLGKSLIWRTSWSTIHIISSHLRASLVVLCLVFRLRLMKCGQRIVDRDIMSRYRVVNSIILFHLLCSFEFFLFSLEEEQPHWIIFVGSMKLIMIRHQVDQPPNFTWIGVCQPATFLEISNWGNLILEGLTWPAVRSGHAATQAYIGSRQLELKGQYLFRTGILQWYLLLFRSLMT